jgi:hypothetical protein
LVGDIPAEDGKTVNLFYSVVRDSLYSFDPTKDLQETDP